MATLRLRREPERLGAALAATADGLRPACVTAYVRGAAMATLRGAPAPWPPWLAAAESLGGNAETRSWRSGAARPRAA